MSKFGPWTPDDDNVRDKFYEKLPVEGAGNLYFNGARPNSREKDAYVNEDNKIFLRLVEKEGRPVLDSNITELASERKCSVISSAVLGMAFEPEQRFEDPDGKEIVFNEDYFGEHRDVNPIPGPFTDPKQAKDPLF